jgi:hypothetical protein
VVDDALLFQRRADTHDDRPESALPHRLDDGNGARPIATGPNLSVSKYHIFDF